MADGSDSSAQMNRERLAEEIRKLYAMNPDHAQVMIEGFLEERFKDLAPDRKLDELSRLIRCFAPACKGVPMLSANEEAFLSRLFTLILGEAVSLADLSSTEVLDRLAVSLNIVFDSLNQLVAVIENVLYGGGTAGLSSIRHAIGSHVQGENDGISLEKYIERIKTAFLDSQKSFQAAAEAQVAELLSELDPERIAQAADGGVKFGPFHKAEMYRRYEEQFEKCKKWFDSGRFKMELQRAFEKNCEALSKTQGG